MIHISFINGNEKNFWLTGGNKVGSEGIFFSQRDSAYNFRILSSSESNDSCILRDKYWLQADDLVKKSVTYLGTSNVTGR